MKTLKLKSDRFPAFRAQLFWVALIAWLVSSRIIAQTVPSNPQDVPLYTDEYVYVPSPPTPIAKNDPMQRSKVQLSAIKRVNEKLSRYRAHPEQETPDGLARLATIMLRVTGARDVISGAWFTAAMLINYRSVHFRGFPEGAMPYVARPCSLANSSSVLTTANYMRFNLKYADCTFDLNDRLGFAHQPAIMKVIEPSSGTAKSFHLWFLGVKIKYDLSLPSIGFSEFDCVDCIFEITSMKHPSAEQQIFIRTLLADDPRAILVKE
jgi:hypothetical protein